jgi:fatty acid desaturase
MTHPPKERLLELHRPTWAGAVTWMVFGIAFSALEVLLYWLLSGELVGVGSFVVLGLLVVVIAHLMHAHLIAFHEAAHGSLSPVRWLNDFFGLHVSPFNLLIPNFTDSLC